MPSLIQSELQPDGGFKVICNGVPVYLITKDPLDKAYVILRYRNGEVRTEQLGRDKSAQVLLTRIIQAGGSK